MAGRGLEAALLLHDLGDVAGDHALDIHGGDGRFEGVVAVRTLLSNEVRKGVVAFTNLWGEKFEGDDGGLEMVGLEGVGVAFAFDSALLGDGSDVLFAFEQHGGVHKNFRDSG